MKRLAFVLAAAVLGAGCHSSPPCNPTSLTVVWDFQRFDGAVLGCAGAGVSGVDVFLDGTQVGRGSPCTDGGISITNVPPGGHSLMVEGVDGSGNILYRDQGSVHVASCGDTAVGARPAEGTANLNYGLAPGGACNVSPCYLWFSVTDTIANVVASAVSASSPPSVQTSFVYPNDVVIRLAAGTYQLDFMQLVGGDFLSEAMTCGPGGFSVAAAAPTTVTPTLDPACR